MSNRTIRVLGTKVIKQGQGPKGPWTLRSVEATDMDGNPIDLPLKTFADLPPGEVDVEVEPQDHEQYGRSYMLKPTKSGGGGRPAAAAPAATSALEPLIARIVRLESEVKRLSGLLDRRYPDDVPAGSSAAPNPDF